MKTISLFTLLILIAGIIPSQSSAQYHMDLPKEDLSDQEILSLKKMREEEMLAHDVYLAFSELYSTPVFRNISKSEAQHTTVIADLLGKYELEDPAAAHETGKFTDAHFQELYTGLVDRGRTSFEEAVRVGLLIEDMDIADLQQALEDETDNADIKMVYGNLLRGSKNHMKAFHFHASNAGLEYEPVYISKSQFVEITGSEKP
jgi:hypothetical protein